MPHFFSIRRGLVAALLAATLLAACGSDRGAAPPPTAPPATAAPTTVPSSTAAATAAPAPSAEATATPAPTAEPAASEWREGPGGDLNGDGVPDQISYRPVSIQLPPVGFSDPSIVALMLAEELILRQEASPGGRDLLVLNPHALSAEGSILAQFDGDSPPAGFIVVVYSGDPHTLRVTALRGDGQPYGDLAYEVAWDAAAGGYRVR